jgi:hypothetical protein
MVVYSSTFPPIHRNFTKISQANQANNRYDESGSHSHSRKEFMKSKLTPLYPTIFAMALMLAVLGPQIPYLQRDFGRPPDAGPIILSIKPEPETCTMTDDCVIAVNIWWDGNDDNDLYVILLPDPNDDGQTWWTQDLPRQTGEGEWTVSKVYIGQHGDEPGLPFRICAIVTNKSLKPGQSWPQNKVLGWEKSEDCVDITRGSAS